MGVWLQSRSTVYGLRDGTTHEHPMLGVGPGQPTYFARRTAEQHVQDKDVFVVDRAAPPANYQAPTIAELKAERLERRAQLAAEREAAKAAKAEAAKAAKAEASKPRPAAEGEGDDDEDEAPETEEPKGPKAKGAKGAKKGPNRAALKALDGEAEKGEREVL